MEVGIHLWRYVRRGRSGFRDSWVMNIRSVQLQPLVTEPPWIFVRLQDRQRKLSVAVAWVTSGLATGVVGRGWGSGLV